MFGISGGIRGGNMIDKKELEPLKRNAIVINYNEENREKIPKEVQKLEENLIYQRIFNGITTMEKIIKEKLQIDHFHS